jgi:hypothetical protein
MRPLGWHSNLKDLKRGMACPIHRDQLAVSTGQRTQPTVIGPVVIRGCGWLHGGPRHTLALERGGARPGD